MIAIEDTCLNESIIQIIIQVINGRVKKINNKRADLPSSTGCITVFCSTGKTFNFEPDEELPWRHILHTYDEYDLC